MNKKFMRFCDMQRDVIPNIKYMAKSAEENRVMNEWLTANAGKASEQDFIEFVDRNLPELAERCGNEVTEETYREYLHMINYTKTHDRW